VLAYAAQDTSIDVVEVRDPRRLKTYLEANASDAQTRIAAVEAAGVGGALASGKIIVGNAGGTGAAVTVTGDISLSNAGVAAIASGAIINADVATNAAIVGSKLDLSAAGAIGATTPADGKFTEVTSDGKYAVTGGDATTGLMVQKAACTAGTNATETISFAVAFGAAPIVTCTYTEDPGDVRPIFVTSVTASNFVANITADKNYGYIAVGSRP
jgi:hypothetical protein